MTTSLGMPTVGPLPQPAPGCNCALCGFYTGNPAAAEPVCSGCSSSCEFCGCSRAGAGSGCALCPVRCGSRTDIAAWMGDLGRTVRFESVTLAGRLPGGLPRLIPQVATVGGLRRFDQDLHWPAYAIGLRRVFSPATGTMFRGLTAGPARQSLGLAPDQQAVLACYGEDPLIEAYWTWRKARRLAEQVAAQEWDLVLAPNFSVYGNQPRAEQLINMRRSLLAASEFSSAGLAAVPNVYWYRLEDLRRWSEWVAGTGPPAIAINAQTMRSARDWDTWLYPGLCWLAGSLPAGLPIIMTGLSRPARISQVAALFSGLIVVSQNPYQYAQHGAVMTAAGRRDARARAPDAFAASVRYMNSLLPP
jgi:Domain of unknown function (DUF4417)